MGEFVSSGIRYAAGTPLGIDKSCVPVETDDCLCKTLDWCQPIIPEEDTLAFQFKAPLQDNIIEGGDINTTIDFSKWTLLENWGIFQDVNAIRTGFCHIAGSTSPMTQAGVLIIGAIYKITVKTFGVSAGTLFIEGNPTNSIAGNGEFVFFFSASFTSLRLIPSFDFDGCVDSVNVQKLGENFTVNIIDGEGNIDATIPGININQFGEDVIVSIPWEDLGLDLKDCYNIRVFDDNNIIEDTFEVGNQLGWEIENLAIDGTLAYFTGFPVEGFAILEGVLDVGCEYTVTYDFTLDPMTDTNVRVILGETEGVLRSIAGTYVENFIVTGNGNVRFEFNNSASGNGNVDNLIITKISADGISECVNLQSSFDCDLKFKWRNKENAFAHNYKDDTSFFHELRLCGKVRIGSYPQESVMDLSSNGVKDKSFGEYRKSKNLQLEPVPEYIHDALASMMTHDQWFIDNARFVLDGDYEAEDNNESDLFGAVVEIEQRSQPDQRNVNC